MQAKTITVSELLNRSIGGDRVALQQLLRRHATGLMQHVESQLPSSIQSVVDADDILQLTFIDAFQKIEQFKPYNGSAFAPWLNGIADLHLARIIHEPTDASFCRHLFSKGEMDFWASPFASPNKVPRFVGEIATNCR